LFFKEHYAKKSFVTDLNNLVKNHDHKQVDLVINFIDISTCPYGSGYNYRNQKEYTYKDCRKYGDDPLYFVRQQK